METSASNITRLLPLPNGPMMVTMGFGLVARKSHPFTSPSCRHSVFNQPSVIDPCSAICSHDTSRLSIPDP
jgi:hypothetical protein